GRGHAGLCGLRFLAGASRRGNRLGRTFARRARLDRSFGLGGNRRGNLRRCPSLDGGGRLGRGGNLRRRGNLCGRRSLDGGGRLGRRGNLRRCPSLGRRGRLGRTIGRRGRLGRNIGRRANRLGSLDRRGSLRRGSLRR